MVETDGGTATAARVETEESDEVPEEVSPSRNPDVFISYRLDPDQATAIALKKLIAGSLDPAPAVFVSGAGGLVPSSIGMRPQIQKAVASSRAFVAVITPQSKDREWIVFEAGAAWGRGQLYSPVLIDTEHHELGTTIADFVATRAEARDQMENLVRELAKTLGAAVKTHFGTRFAAFERHLQQRRGIEQKSTSSEPGTGSARAYSLWREGKREEALAAFADAEAQAKTAEERADTRIARLLVQHEGDRFREVLEGLDEDIRATACWNLWKGVTAGSPHVAVRYYEQVIASTAALPIDRTYALRGRVENLFALGKKEAATKAAIDAIMSEPGEKRWPIAAILWSEIPELAPEAKLLLAALSVAHADQDLFRRLSDLAIDEGWVGLGIFAARSYRRKEETPSSLNMVGRAYHAASLMSLAHDAYQEAIVAGTSVARVNLALCLIRQPNSGAALALLREHKGDFDSLDPAFAHQIRAEAEKAVAAEKKAADEFSRRAYKVMIMLSELLAAPEATTAPQEMQIDTSGSAPFSKLGSIPPFAGVFLGKGDGSSVGFFVPRSDATGLRGVTFNLHGDTEPTWTTVKV